MARTLVPPPPTRFGSSSAQAKALSPARQTVQPPPISFGPRGATALAAPHRSASGIIQRSSPAPTPTPAPTPATPTSDVEPPAMEENKGPAIGSAPDWIKNLKPNSCAQISNKAIPPAKLVGKDLGNSATHYMICTKNSGGILDFVVTTSKQKKGFTPLRHPMEPFKKPTFISDISFSITHDELHKAQTTRPKITILP